MSASQAASFEQRLEAEREQNDDERLEEDERRWRVAKAANNTAAVAAAREAWRASKAIVDAKLAKPEDKKRLRRERDQRVKEAIAARCHTDLPPLETIRKQGNPSYGSVINFDRRTSKEKKNDMAKWCVMCGKNEGTGDGCVRIPTQNKDVCDTCDSTFWKHNASGAYFKWCKGKKNFQEIHAFADNLKASKCDEERSRSSSGPARASEDARRAAMGPPTAVVAPPGQAAAAEPLREEQLRLVSELQIESSSNRALVQLLLRVAEATRSDGCLRKGKWPIAESDLTEAFIAQFGHRTLPLQPGAWLRLFIARVLNCDPDRITKKFAGDSSLGKRVFVLSEQNFDLDDVARRLQPLVDPFIQSLQARSRPASRSASRSNSPRPAIARAASPPPLPPAGVPPPPANAARPVAAPAPAAPVEPMTDN